MNPEISKEHKESYELSSEQLWNIVRSFGLVVSHAFLYGINHSVTIRAEEECFNILSDIFKYVPEITFSLSEGGILINGNPVESKNPLVRTLVAHLQEREIGGFSFVKGLTREKFHEIISILNSKPNEIKQSGGFASLVTSRSLDGIKVRQVVYRQIFEDDIVVSASDIGVEGVIPPDKAIETVVSVLKGKAGELSDKAVQNALEEVVKDEEKFVESVSRAVKEEISASGKRDDMAKAVAGCIKRIYEEAIQKCGKSARNRFATTLAKVEKEITSRLKEELGEINPDEEEAIVEALDGISDELKIDILATEYLKRRSAIESAEKKILTFIRAKGIENITRSELIEKFGSMGFTEEEIDNLLVKSGIFQEKARKTMESVGKIATLVAGLENVAKEGDIDPKKLEQTLVEINKELDSIARRAEQRILELVKEPEIEREEPSIKKEDKRKIRDQLLKILGELGQEICQPLSVINCSLNILCKESLGPLANSQKELLKLACSNVERLNFLVNKLIEVTGLPETLLPDRETLDKIYNK